MHLIAPDVLAEARGLSPVLSGLGVLIGALLWFCGWRWHRLWVVIAVTLIGGLLGVQAGKSSGGHIVAMGVLLALAAGLLALELARVFAFVAAGTSVWMAASALFPNGQELWVGFLIGGLLGVLLYRFWTMLLTSFVGVLVSWHCGLCLTETLMAFDAAAFAEQQSLILNGAGMAVTVLGVVTQSWIERWHLRRQKRRKLDAVEKIREQEREKVKAEIPPPPKAAPPSMWDKFLGRKKKAA
jgi:hypothetical protein